MATKVNRHLAKTELIEQVPAACADELAAIEFFERQRWGGVPRCAHCDDTNVYTIKDRKTGERRTDGRWRCRKCGQQFTVRVGQIMEDSPIPLRKWAYAFWCAATAKNGVSALEMSRKLQVTYKSALFMMNRIRWAMCPSGPEPKLAGTVEMDETYVGGKVRFRRKRGQQRAMGRSTGNKVPVVAVVQRGGDVRTQIVADVTADSLNDVLTENVAKGSQIMTDDWPAYRRIVRKHGIHQFVKHSLKQYVKGDNNEIHMNTVEGFFARVKRQLAGTYHAVSREHLHRYMSHAAFLYNGRAMSDGERLACLMKSADGNRRMLKTPDRKAG